MNIQDYIGLSYAKYDCFAFVRLVAGQMFGITYPVIEEFSPTPRSVTSKELERPNWIKIDWVDRRPGDVVALSPTPGPAPHVGIVISDVYILHSDKKLGVVAQTAEAIRRRGYLYKQVYRWVDFK